MKLRIDERTSGDAVILDLHGKITAGDAAIYDAMAAQVARGVRRLVLNFADVSYMDSVGLSALVRSHLSVQQHDGRLALLSVPRQIAALLSATRLTTIFNLFDDEAAAIRHVSGDN